MRFAQTTGMALASIVSLAAAASILHSEVLEAMELEQRSPADPKYTIDPNHYCLDSTGWPDFGELTFVDALHYMSRPSDLTEDEKDDLPEIYHGTRGKCTNLWCGGKGDESLVVYLCVRPETTTDVSINSKDVVKKIHDGFWDCRHEREPDRDNKDHGQTFHVWEEGYHITVTGGPNMDCAADMGRVMFDFPWKFNYAPYTQTPLPA